ncbi:MAG: protein phosphatase 2C domain-containing protein [Spirochaetes bacterium]|nr:protein phosphatase 2C domain-containing protein [Spirochaetota bacterium]
MTEGFSKSIQGASHVKNNKPCQDASGYFNEGHYSLVVVADGHGDEKYFRSDKGALYAVKVVKQVVDIFFNTQNTSITENDAQNIKHNIILQWRKAVLSDIKANPWTEKESTVSPNLSLEDTTAYGTTLIAVVLTKHRWLALQIGDGRCTVIDGAGAFFPIADDRSQGIGSTHSLCENNALQHFHHVLGNGQLLGAIAATDGVTDSLSPDYYLYRFMVNMLKSFIENPSAAKEELTNNVLPELSQKGSKDDVSIACVFNTEDARHKLSRIIDISKKIYEGNSRYETLEKENKTNKSKIYTLENDISDRNKTLERNNKTLEEKLQEAEKKERLALTSVSKKYKAEIEELQKIIEQLKKDEKKYKKVFDELNEQHEKKLQEVEDKERAALTSASKKYKADIEKLQETIKQQREYIERLERTQKPPENNSMEVEITIRQRKKDEQAEDGDTDEKKNLD